MRYQNIFFYAFIVIMAISCTKKEGEGGTASINGQVMVSLVSDDFEKEYASFPEEQKDVYIIYGDDDYFSDKTETSYDGKYHFGYLRKGSYKIFAYSDDSSGASESGKIPVIQSVEVKKNGEIVEMPAIRVYDQVSHYEGSSSIEGKVFAYDYNSNMTILKDSFYLRNEYVYLARLEDNYYFERQRTFYDGSFVFTSLPIGHYQVYVYSRDSTMLDPQDEVPVIVVDSITANRQHLDIGRINIIN